MYCISTTIKKKYMDKILSGEKTSEFKAATPFWDTRLNKARESIVVEINFLCGRNSYRYRVMEVYYFHNNRMVIDGKEYYGYWEIELGERLR